jgi:PKD repeat protein
MRTRPYPFIAADNSFGPNRGRLYCVYATNDPPGSGNKPNIYCRHSDDGGSTWSGAVLVNDDFNTQANHQWSPAIWCEKSSGRLYIQWMDTRDCPTSDSCLIYATYSDNGGESFAQNQAISNEKMRINCTTCGGGGTPRYQGDYNGIVSNSSVSMATWADYRDGKFDSYVAYFPDYSMFVSPETLPVEGSDTLYVQFPEVKLYTGSVIVSVQVQNPGAGQFTVSFPNGSILANLPGEVPVVISASPEVPIGPYLVQVTAKGPNGTPVHKRTSTIDVLPLGPPIADFAADTTEFCAGWAVNFMDMTTNGPSEWEWSFPGGTPETSTEQNPEDIVYAEAGVYTVTLVSSNVAGSDTITKVDYITVNEVPGVPSGVDVTVCASENVPDLYAEGDNILWYDDPELTNLVNTGNTFVTGITEPGIYPFYATQTLGSCEGEPLTITLTIHALPEVTLEPFEDVCLDSGPFELTGGMPEGGEYSGAGVTDGTFDPLASGTGIFEISYTFTDTNGCTNSTFTTIGVNPTPDIDLGQDTDICEGESHVLNAGPGFASYEWNTGETTESITVTQAGMYSVLVTNDFGCTDFDEVNVNVLPLPGQTTQPAGPIEVDNFLEPVSAYTTSGADNADSYFWSIDPVAAGTISGTGLEAVVTWTDGYSGTASITVYGINDCGNGEISDAITAQVYTSQGLDENAIGQIRIYPNPNKGTFNLEISTLTERSLNVIMTNSLGEVVYRKDNLRVNGKVSETIRTGASSPGMLILQVSDGKNTWQDKVFIEK